MCRRKENQGFNKSLLINDTSNQYQIQRKKPDIIILKYNRKKLRG